MSYRQQVCIASAQLVNAILGGWADETPSCRVQRQCEAGKRWARVMLTVIDFAFSWQRGSPRSHCFRAWMNARTRRAIAPENR